MRSNQEKFTLDWQDLHHFVMFGQLGSITAAARALRVDHATVSRRIAGLEQSTGLKLVVRLAKSSRLTEEGEALVSIASQMANIAEAVRYYIRRATSLSRTVTISAPPALTSFIIAPSVARLRKKYPELNVVLNSSSIAASPALGEADIAIGFLRSENPARVVRRIGVLRLGLYSTLDMLSRAESEWEFVGFEDTPAHLAQQAWLGKFAEGRGFALRTSDVITQQAAAGAGIGIAALPFFVAERDPRLMKVSVEGEPPAHELWISIHADLRKLPAVRVTIDHLIEIFKAVSSGSPAEAKLS